MKIKEDMESKILSILDTLAGGIWSYRQDGIGLCAYCLNKAGSGHSSDCIVILADGIMHEIKESEEKASRIYILTMESDAYGSESFQYDTIDELMEGFNRIKEKIVKSELNNTGCFQRTFTVSWEDIES